MATSAEAPPRDDMVRLPRYDVFGFNEWGKGRPVDELDIPQRWLLASARTTTGLWLTEMPSGALPDVAAEGDTIVCRDPESQLQDRRVYIFLLDGRPIVRRIFLRPDHVLLTGSDPADEISLRPDELDRLMPAGRVLGAINLTPV